MNGGWCCAPTPDLLGPRPSLAGAAEGRERLDNFLVLTGFDCRFYLSLHLPPFIEAKVKGPFQ